MQRLGNQTLGCNNDYKFYITSSCSNVPLRRLPTRSIVSFDANRILDDIADAKVTFCVTQDIQNCSDFLQFLCLARHYLVIERNGIIEFKGPTVRLEYDEGNINLYARDPLWWAKKRYAFTSNNTAAYTSATNQFEVDILQELQLLNGTPQECPAGFHNFNPICFDEVYKRPGGTPIATDADQKLNTLDILLKDYADTFLDYTVVGTDLYYGYKEIRVPEKRLQPRPLLDNNSWCSPPRIVQDIQDYANEAAVKYKEADPNAPDTVRYSECDNPKHGLHQKILSRTELVSAVDAEEAAKTFVEHNENAITYIENSGSTALDQNVFWDLPRMVPGMLVDVNINQYGIEVFGTFRLHEVIFSGNAKGEVVKISLEPIGTEI